MEFSRHALERYVERIENKFGNERNIFIAQNKDRIEERLLKLYQSAEEIYQGKLRENGVTKFFFNKNGWVIITDINKSKIITVYKVDLKLGEELNKQFWELALTKLADIKNQKAKYELDQVIKNEQIDRDISSNFNKINELKTAIADLEKQNQILADTKQTGKSGLIILESEIKNTIEALVSDRIF